MLAQRTRLRNLDLSPKCMRMASAAREWMVEYGLFNWTFGFNRRKRSLGICMLGRKRIELSHYMVDLNGEEQILDVILHEIAHALAWERHRDKSHGPIWKRICIEVAAKPERCCSTGNMPTERRYTATCGRCFTVYRRDRLSQYRFYYCPKCGREHGNLNFTQK